MRLGRDDAPDGVKSVLSGLPWPLATVMPVTLRSCSIPGHEGWPKPNAQFDPAWSAKFRAAFETGKVRKPVQVTPFGNRSVYGSNGSDSARSLERPLTALNGSGCLK
jgi:hypothetical protein